MTKSTLAILQRRVWSARLEVAQVSRHWGNICVAGHVEDTGVVLTQGAHSGVGETHITDYGTAE